MMSGRENGLTVRLDGVSAGYHGRAVLSGAELTFRKGEVTALIGPNGAGKSTLLKTIASLLEPVAGTVYLGEKPAGEVPARERAKMLSVMLTERPRAEYMTAYETAALGRYPYTDRFGRETERDREIVTEALRMTGALSYADRGFSELSDGQKQSVLLSRAIAQEPEVMVLDEPASFLDIRNQAALLKTIARSAHERGIAVILSLHEIRLAESFADRVILVGDGGIRGDGTPEEMITSERISELFKITDGVYDPLTGQVESRSGAAPGDMTSGRGGAKDGKPEPAVPEPAVFVISSSGRGIPVYRKLSRAGIPFAAGILYPNDLDFPAASRLASEVVSEKAFSPISEESLGRALELMRRCGRVIDAGFETGEMNEKMWELREAAAREGLLTTAEEVCGLRGSGMPGSGEEKDRSF